jgi:hypothetical protein
MSNCRFDMIPIVGICDYSHRITPLSLQNDRGATITPEKKVRRKKAPLKENSEIELEFGVKLFPDPSPKMITLTLPIRTVSEANCTEPWQKRHKRHKLQKKTIFFELLPYKYLISTPCTITLIRYAPKELDKHDNLPMSFKYLLDGLAAEISGDYRPGRADSSNNFTIHYDQVKSKAYGVKIIIEFD